MYQDEIFENALKEAREESFRELKSEVKSVEAVIERLLTQLLECSSALTERDFHVCGVQKLIRDFEIRKRAVGRRLFVLGYIWEILILSVLFWVINIV